MKPYGVSALLLFSFTLLAIICVIHAGGFVNKDKDKTVPEQQNVEKKWWQTTTFYQIYPRSFKDSDGDGIGDLNGITQQLPYLKEIGITATWLSPIFTSPMADFGYDISNFTEIDPVFGTMADFEALIAKANELKIKIILDFVPNHTSDECLWFKLSAAGDPIYKDFYVWHEGKIVDGKRQPPTNWISVFRGPTWTWHEERQAYYLHQFLNKQPDLNFVNPKVREAMNEILRFWLGKGVAGFRLDAVPFLYEIAPDADGNLPDEPRNSWEPDPTSHFSLDHIYTFDRPESVGEVYGWRSVLQQFQNEHGGDERVLLSEAYSPNEILMQYYGNGTHEGVQVPFNFNLILQIKNNSDAYQYAEAVNSWLKVMPEGRTANWQLGNHDNTRVGSRLGTDRIDMMNMLVLSLPGVAVTYYGEEIGMTNVWISWKDTVDPGACNTNPSEYEQISRDNERTPFQWNDGKNAGFSVAAKPWLPVANNYKNLNVKRERGFHLSHLNIYKKLQALRKEPTMLHGDVEVKAVASKSVLGVRRSFRHDFTFVTLLNIFDNFETVDLTRVFNNLPAEFVYHIVTDRSVARVGDIVKSNMIRLLPKEAVVLRSASKLFY